MIVAAQAAGGADGGVERYALIGPERGEVVGRERHEVCVAVRALDVVGLLHACPHVFCGDPHRVGSVPNEHLSSVGKAVPVRSVGWGPSSSPPPHDNPLVARTVKVVARISLRVCLILDSVLLWVGRFFTPPVAKFVFLACVFQ